MFVLLFAFVFGSAIPIPSGVELPRVPDGRDLRPDRHLRRRRSPAPASPTTCRRASSTGSGRCRCRAVAPCSPAGRSADVVNNVIVLIVMSLTGLIVGWRIHGVVPRGARRRSCCCCCSPTRSPGSWRVVGLVVRTPEVGNNAGFIGIFPLTFIANAFVPIDNFPTVAARRSPSGTRSRAVDPGGRELFGNLGAHAAGGPRGRCSTRRSTR